jgi:hypothetical protein
MGDARFVGAEAVVKRSASGDDCLLLSQVGKKAWFGGGSSGREF